MTKSELMADLEHASRIAKDGANTPLLGGPIGLMWGCLLIPTLILHGLTLIDVLPVAKNNVGLFWLIYGMVGTILSVILGRRINKKPGAKSIINKVGSAMGISMGIIIFAYAIATVFVAVTQSLPIFIYNFIIVFAFGLMTLDLAVLAKLSGHSYLRIAAIAAGIFMVVTLLMATKPEVYFVAAAGVFVAQVIPSLIEIKNETKNA